MIEPAVAEHRFESNEPGSQPTPAWRVALLVASSVLLSGIAVVLWNRHALERMRQGYAVPPVENPEEFI